MDIHRWLKYMTQPSNVCGASPVNNNILFFDGHDSNFNDGALIQIMCKNIQHFVLKPGYSINEQPNYNGPNAKLKSLYNMEKSAWMLKYGMKKFSPHHMNSVLIEAWGAFNISSGKIIRDIFSKIIYPPSALPT